MYLQFSSSFIKKFLGPLVQKKFGNFASLSPRSEGCTATLVGGEPLSLLGWEHHTVTELRLPDQSFKKVKNEAANLETSKIEAKINGGRQTSVLLGNITQLQS